MGRYHDDWRIRPRTIAEIEARVRNTMQWEIAVGMRGAIHEADLDALLALARAGAEQEGR